MREALFVERLRKRFWAQVEPGENGCLIWTGRRAHDPRYGSISVRKVLRAAHRVAYELEVGPIPVGLQLDHLCRNPICVNPEHLEPVTPRENVLRGKGPPALNARKTHCVHGHEFTPENTYTGKGHRDCRQCYNRYMRERRARRIAEGKRPN